MSSSLVKIGIVLLPDWGCMSLRISWPLERWLSKSSPIYFWNSESTAFILHSCLSLLLDSLHLLPDKPRAQTWKTPRIGASDFFSATSRYSERVCPGWRPGELYFEKLPGWLRFSIWMVASGGRDQFHFSLYPEHLREYLSDWINDLTEWKINETLLDLISLSSLHVLQRFLYLPHFLSYPEFLQTRVNIWFFCTLPCQCQPRHLALGRCSIFVEWTGGVSFSGLQHHQFSTLSITCISTKIPVVKTII